MSYTTHYINAARTYRTDAPSGRYIGQSNLKCECCDGPITSTHFLCVHEGEFVPASVDRVADQLAMLHPSHSLLTGLKWLGDGTIECTFEGTE